MSQTVVVGGGLAAQRFIETYRREGGKDPITLISAEQERPYDRPPLSKASLGDSSLSTHFRSEDWYRDNNVELILGDEAISLASDSKHLTLASGRTQSYDRLLIATGGQARMIPGFDRFENSHTLRNADDSRRLSAALQPGTKIAIIGAGFIGLEVASTAVSLGAIPTVVEAEPIPLRGLLGEQLGEWLADWHRNQGVEVICGVGVSEVLGEGRAEAIQLADGTRIELDELLVAVGAKPSVDWLDGSGLAIDGGILCAADGRTEIDGVWAAGDAASPWNATDNQHRRAEHWEAAAAQGRAAARSVLGLDHKAGPLTSFWSDMHGVRLQHFGHPGEADRIAIDGDLQSSDFEAIWYSGETPVAALAVGRPRSLPKLRKLFTETATNTPT